MSARRALVVHTRMPAFDRDAGSQAIDHAIGWLLRSGWQVTFVSRETADVAEERHAERLRQLGVAAYAGLDWVDRLIRSGSFDLALISFWELSAQLIPTLREHSPGTRVLLNSIDVHFLREARRSLGQGQPLGGTFGSDVVKELNTYHSADGVIAVSEEERSLLAGFVGAERVHRVPLAEGIARSTVPLADRRGLFFVGNFRHLPNREAVEYFASEVLPLIDPALLDRHPLTVAGNYLDQVQLDVDPATPGLHLVGWVPSVEPFLHRSRLSVVPLLHGAGVKGKVIESLMAGTPLVTTPIGAEGLDLVQGTHALIAADASDFAAAVTRLLVDDELWTAVADAGAEHAAAGHSLDQVEGTFLAVVDEVLRQPARGDGGTGNHARAVRERVQLLVDPGSTVLVASAGDAALVDLGSITGRHFPSDAAGAWTALAPGDGAAAVELLESERVAGARYLALPKGASSWRFRFPELHHHLVTRYRRLYVDDDVSVYDLADKGGGGWRRDPPPAATVLVVGTYDARRTGPPPSLVADLAATSALTIEQRWRASAADSDDSADIDGGAADFVVHVDDRAIVPTGFLDELIATQVALDVDRLQPTHRGGPGAAPPITERHRGTLAREVGGPTVLPVLSVRRGADRAGPTTLADCLPISLRQPLSAATPDQPSEVLRLWTAGDDGQPLRFDRIEPPQPPRISVLVSTYNRPDLLAECLESFAGQTLPVTDYEVVVVDDGSDDPLGPVLEKVADRMQVLGVRIDHAGRAAAKNHAVMLARAPVVLFFDDDDRAAPDYLERHLAAHDTRPGEGVAVLGHTDWAPELEQTALMHYVTDVDRLLFAYERLADGQELDWRGFWEGRISCKRAFLVAHALHDQRLAYSIDVEMGWRLAPFGLRIVYDASARSFMARPLDLDTFCARTEAKGRAHAITASLHPGTAMAGYLALDEAIRHWDANRFTEDRLRARVGELERRAAEDPGALEVLHAAYRELFRLLHAKGVAGAARPEGAPPPAAPQAFTVTPAADDPEFVADGSPAGAAAQPELSIVIPVWSRTPELAAMAQRTVERIWEVAAVPTEVVVIDNGSPHVVPLWARVHRYPENKGVSAAWNTGIRLSRAPVLAVLNSDCLVEPGWDEALIEAARDGRRVAFPYTDHGDGLGFVTPDQGGTAGWCFVLTRAVYDEVGVFDEWFSPAYGEDTDYWHRAWQLGVELSPVPAARVVHSRRTTAKIDPRVDWLLLGHRYKYGWKHGVDPLRAPPYYNRDVVEYRGSIDPAR